LGRKRQTAMSGNADHKVQGYILAGGGSTRFRLDKALVEFDGQPMLLRIRELLRSILDEVVVIAAPAKYASIGVESTADHWPGQGPLGGIITALLASSAGQQAREWNLIVGCDMPFLTREWLQHLVQRALSSDGDVVAPQSAKGLEPLCACWRTSAAPKLQHAFENGVRKIAEAMKHIGLEIIAEPEWKRFDSAGRLFWNMNTLADYEEATRIRRTERA
jgi:molybdopterin-guanine dinucleotide biosynthesis protein A